MFLKICYNYLFYRLKNSNTIKNKIKLSTSSKLFFIFYIIAIIGMYAFFPYNSFFLYKISTQTINHSSFIIRLNIFQTNILEIFNAYREYIFDNKSIIQGMTPYEYIIKKDNEMLKSLTSDINGITKYIYDYVTFDEELMLIITKELCTYYITDYFNSTEHCKTEFGSILNYDFNVIVSNFLQRIRYTKNIIKYKFEKEYIIGDLTLYEVEKWSKWNNTYFGEEYIDKGDKLMSFKLDLFNNETLHSEMNLIFLNIFLPYIDENRKGITVRLNIDGQKKYFLFYFLIYIILLIFIYIIFLIPMLIYIKEFIYKTKNMLLLVPISILVSQKNIKSLLN